MRNKMGNTHEKGLHGRPPPLEGTSPFAKSRDLPMALGYGYFNPHAHICTSARRSGNAVRPQPAVVGPCSEKRKAECRASLRGGSPSALAAVVRCAQAELDVPCAVRRLRGGSLPQKVGVRKANP